MVVALIALVVALSGTAFAAVNYARNAGAVDGKSAVSARSTLGHAAGNLVATQTSGRGKGRIPAKFVDGVIRGGSTTLNRYLRVVDNREGVSTALAIIPGIGRLDAQCNDQDPRVSVESTKTFITFTGSEPGGVNVSRLLGRDIDSARDPVVFSVLPTQPLPVIDSAEPLFQLVLQAGQRTVLVVGSTRTNANDTADAACLIFGVALRVG